MYISKVKGEWVDKCLSGWETEGFITDDSGTLCLYDSEENEVRAIAPGDELWELCQPYLVEAQAGLDRVIAERDEVDRCRAIALQIESSFSGVKIPGKIDGIKRTWIARVGNNGSFALSKGEIAWFGQPINSWCPCQILKQWGYDEYWKESVEESVKFLKRELGLLPKKK